MVRYQPGGKTVFELRFWDGVCGMNGRRRRRDSREIFGRYSLQGEQGKQGEQGDVQAVQGLVLSVAGIGCWREHVKCHA